MNGYPYPTRPYNQPTNGNMMLDINGDGINSYGMVEGQSLDSIVTQNDKDNRRRSMPAFTRQQQPQQQLNLSSPNTRRMSMMNFGDPNGGDMDEFQFDMSTAAMDNIIHA